MSVSKTKTAKKRNRKKLVNQIEIPKSKVKKDTKNEKKPENENNEKAEEEKKHEPEEDKKEDEKPPEITDKEIIALNNEIYHDVYTMIISKLKEPQLLKTLCSRFSIKLDELDAKPAIKQICRVIIKERMKPHLDFKKPKDLKTRESFKLLGQDSPELVLIKEIVEKLLFLLEINPSLDLVSQILEGDKQDAILDRLRSSKELNLLKSSNSQFEGSSDGEVSMQRSKSAIVNYQSKHTLGHKGSRKAPRGSKFKPGSISTKNKEIQLQEKSQASSFTAVVSFVTNSTIRNLNTIRESIDAHRSTADARLQGFEYLNKLLKHIKMTNQSRALISPLTMSVGNNPFSGIEASGVDKLKNINNRIKEMLKHCIVIFTRDYTKLKQTVSDYIKARQPTQINGKTQAFRFTSADELVISSQIRSLLECLNDMIVILSDNPAKEAFILHIVIEFTKSDTDFAEFLTNLIGLILDTKDSLIVLNKSHISENLISQTQTAAKLLLHKFLIKDTEDSQLSMEAHNLLQETLLEIIVNMLNAEMKKEEDNEIPGKNFDTILLLVSCLFLE